MSTLESFVCPGCNAGVSWHEGTTDSAGYWLCPTCDTIYAGESRLEKRVVGGDNDKGKFKDKDKAAEDKAKG